MTSPATLTDAVRAAVLYQITALHTSFPGIIISYDYTIQKATIQPAINKKYTDGTTASMPILNNVPIIFPRSGGASLTFPINKGDTVLVVCAERSLDDWLNTGGQVNPKDPRKLDLSDAMAIPGLYPFSSPSPASNNSDVVLQYSGGQVRIDSSGQVSVEGNSKVAVGANSGILFGKVEVLDILSQLLADLQGLNVTTGFPGPLTPTFIAQALLLQTKIDSIRGTLP